MSLPKRIKILEVGPREGFQFVKTVRIPLEEKVKLVDALSETGVPEIEVTSFVNPKTVPQMADAEDLVRKIRRNPKVRYTAIYLNSKGFERALNTSVLHVEGLLNLSATDSFCRHNSNKSMETSIQDLPKEIELYKSKGIRALTGVLMAAFGCNYEGKVTLSRVLSLVQLMFEACEQTGCQLEKLQLSDTIGWANPEQIKRTIGAIWVRWPDVGISLHLHDTRGTGIANAYAAMQLGVDDFHASVGGLGGCPFAGHQAAAGNIATEDLVFMCHEMGIETGIDLEKYIACAHLAEKIVGHPLPGKLMRSGLNKCGVRLATTPRLCESLERSF